MPIETSSSKGLSTTSTCTKVKTNVTLCGSRNNGVVMKNYPCNSLKPSVVTSSTSSSFSSPIRPPIGSGKLVSKNTTLSTELRNGHSLQQQQITKTTGTSSWKSPSLYKSNTQSPTLSNLRSGKFSQKSPATSSTTTPSLLSASTTTTAANCKPSSSVRLKTIKTPVNNNNNSPSLSVRVTTTNSPILHVKNTTTTNNSTNSALRLIRKTSSPASLMRKEPNNNNTTIHNYNNTPVITHKTTNTSSVITRKANSTQAIEQVGLVTKQQLSSNKGNGSSDSNRGQSKKGVSTAKSVDSLDTNLLSAGEGGNAEIVKGFREEKTSSDSTYVIESDKDLIASRDLEIAQLKDRLRTQDDETRRLQLEISNLKTHKQEKEKLELSVKNMRIKYEETIDELKRQIQTLNDEKMEAFQQRISLESTIKSYEDKFKSTDAEMQEYKIQYTKVQQHGDTTYSNYMKVREDSATLKNQMLEKEKEIATLRSKSDELEKDLMRETNRIQEERMEWKKFETDMLVVVKVAEDFKTEAESRAAMLEKENSFLRERVEVLECPVETKNVGVQMNSLAKSPLVRSQSQLSISSQGDNSSDISAKVSESNTTKYDADFSDKENHSSSSHVSLPPANNNNNIHNNNYTKELEKPSSQIIKPLTHLDSKRNAIFSDLDPLAEPLADLAQKRYGGSKRKALLSWSQDRTQGYDGVDIANFSTSWNDGIALCALLHSYIPSQVPFDSLKPENREKNLATAFKAAESIGVTTQLNIEEMLTERPPWQAIMCYVSEIYNRLAYIGKS